MATILFTWELGGGTGHVVNMLPFVERFVERGHRVFAALRDVSSGSKILADTGVRVVAAPMQLGSARFLVQPARTFAHILHNTGFSTDEQLASLTTAWRNLYALVDPDLIVFEHSPSALLASRGLDAKRAVIGTGFFSPPDVTPLPDLRPWLPPRTSKHCQDENRVHERVCRQLAAWGEPPIERLAHLYRDVDANFLLTFQELDHYVGREGATYWGMPQLAGGQTPSWPAGDGPRVFAYLKRSPLLAPLLAALRERRLPTLAYVDNSNPKFHSRFAAETLYFATQRLNIEKVAQECDFAVLNGNAGTATALLLHGKPMLQLPIYLEQALLSQRVEQLLAGLTCASNQVEHLPTRLEAMIEGDQFAFAARQFADRHADYDEPTSMDNLGEQLENLIESA